jgi:hypothetical protein
MADATDDVLHTDGNEVAGLLQQVFAAEFTTLERRCASCGDRSPAGAHRTYRSAGIVLRCPQCSAVALRLSSQGGRLVFELFGTWTASASQGTLT